MVIHDLVDHLWHLEPTYFACQIGGLSILLMIYGQTVVSLIKRTKHGPSFTLDLSVHVRRAKYAITTKQPSLKLKTQPKQLLSYQPLDFTTIQPNAA